MPRIAGLLIEWTRNAAVVPAATFGARKVG